MTLKRAFITGAGNGIGKRAAQLLLAKGWKVAVTGRGDNIHWADGRKGATVIRCDVTNREDWDHALQQFADEVGGIDVVVNNAGVMYGGDFSDIDLADHDRLIDINFRGVLSGAMASLPYLKRTRGQLINLCSAAAIYGSPGLATYSATKFAVRGLTEALEVEWEKYGIDVKALWPLWTSSTMLDGVPTESIRRMGVNLTVEDVAKALVRCIEHRQRPWLPTKVHYPVGWQATLLKATTHMVPDWIIRFVNAKLTTSEVIRW